MPLLGRPRSGRFLELPLYSRDGGQPLKQGNSKSLHRHASGCFTCINSFILPSEGSISSCWFRFQNNHSACWVENGKGQGGGE